MLLCLFIASTIMSRGKTSANSLILVIFKQLIFDLVARYELTPLDESTKKIIENSVFEALQKHGKDTSLEKICNILKNGICDKDSQIKRIVDLVNTN